MFDGKGLQPLPEMHPLFHGVIYLYLAAWKSIAARANIRWRKDSYQRGKDVLVSSFLCSCAMNGAGFNTHFMLCVTRYMKLSIKEMLIGFQNSFGKMNGRVGIRLDIESKPHRLIY
jgi:hypothetical protein